jgi:hypothetical protein
VYLLGDFFQLPPVRANFIFDATQPALYTRYPPTVRRHLRSDAAARRSATTNELQSAAPDAAGVDAVDVVGQPAAAVIDASIDDDDASPAIHLFLSYFHAIFLRTMHRQADPAFGRALLQLRTGEPDLDTVRLLLSRTATSPPNASVRRQLSEPSWLAAPYLYPTCAEVDAFVCARSLAHGRDSATPVFVIRAFDAIAETVTRVVLPDEIRSNPTRCGGLKEKLWLAVGMPVLYRVNLDASDGLVNGTQGVVRGFVWPEGWNPPVLMPGCHYETDLLPTGVLVSFDNECVAGRGGLGTAVIVDNIRCFRVVPIRTRSFKAIGADGATINVTRIQLPLLEAAALTVRTLFSSQPLSLCLLSTSLYCR